MGAAEDIFAETAALRAKPGDPFRPVVLIKPLSGFPTQIESASPDRQYSVIVSSGDRLQHFQLTTHDRKVDVCDVTFIDDEGFFTQPEQLIHGALIAVSWGYPGKMANPRLLRVQRLKLGMVQGRKWAKRRRGFLVTLQGTAPAKSMMQDEDETGELFEGLKLSQIFRLVAEKMGYNQSQRGSRYLSIVVPAEHDVTYRAKTRPASEKKVQFLSRIAKENGLIFRLGMTGMWIYAKDEEKAPIINVDLDGQTLLGFDLDGDLIVPEPAGLKVIGYEPSVSKTVRVQSRNPKDEKKGKTDSIAHTIQEYNQVMSVASGPNAMTQDLITGTADLNVKKGTSKNAALRIYNTVAYDQRPGVAGKENEKLNRLFHARKKKAWKLRVRIVGDPNVIASETMDLVNFETGLLDGRWYIEEARHTIQNGYITEITAHRPKGVSKEGAGRGDSKLFLATDLPKTEKEKKAEKTDPLRGQVSAGTGILAAPGTWTVGHTRKKGN